MHAQLIQFVRDQYKSTHLIALHEPRFQGRERDYVMDAIDSTFVSSVGVYVDRFERMLEKYTHSPKAVAVMNGTAALHVALRLAGVDYQDLVLTQSLTFVATCNAIHYCGAEPVFIDVDRHTLGLSPGAMEEWLESHALLDEDGRCRQRSDNRIIRCCLPMHTFGHPADLDGLMDVCSRWGLKLVEDAAESLGSYYKGRHTGTFGELGAVSFNGNKLMTTGGGGAVLAGEALGAEAKHLTTTAKRPHAYEYFHDRVGYNYRLPNLNAALGCAQLEQLDHFLQAKRRLADAYRAFFSGSGVQFVVEPDECHSNYWLNSVICEDRDSRDALLSATNDGGVMTRPVWTPMNELPMFRHCAAGALQNAEWLADRLVCLPSSVPVAMT